VDPAHERSPTIDASKYTITQRTGAFVDAKPIGQLVPPQYPPSALHGQKLPVTLTVTIRVGLDGSATYVGPSMVAVSIPSHSDQDFRNAIMAAISKWHFEPAILVHLEPGANGQPTVVDSEEVETTSEVTFTFDPDGGVSAQRVKPPAAKGT
jgi:outer membrane biosynthesis protein TonB